jgi:hypothetical protein
MKFKILAMIVAVGTAVSAYGQGVLIWNIANTGGISATSNGLLYTNNNGNTGLFDGINNNVGIEALGGSGSPSSLLGVFTAATDAKGYTGFDLGKFQAGNAVQVPGVAAGGVATIQLNIWYDGAGGLFPSYAAASSGGGLVASATFQNPTSNPGGIPPSPDQQMVGMPSMTLVVPEPSTIALAGLGIAALLIFRRRN